MKIILDGMGGDNAPASVVEGAVLASKEMEHEIVLIGQQELIEKELKKYKKELDEDPENTVRRRSALLTREKSSQMMRHRCVRCVPRRILPL